MGTPMKRDDYLKELEKIVLKALTKWDVEKMRDALAKAREINERRFEALKRIEFTGRLNR